MCMFVSEEKGEGTIDAIVRRRRRGCLSLWKTLPVVSMYIMYLRKEFGTMGRQTEEWRKLDVC